MVPVNPPLAVAVNVTGCAAPPAVRARLDALSESEKSGVAPPPPPLEVIIPLQPQQKPARATMKAQSSVLCAARRKETIFCILGGKCSRAMRRPPAGDKNIAGDFMI